VIVNFGRDLCRETHFVSGVSQRCPVVTHEEKTMEVENYEQSTVIPCEGVKTENWYAWLDTMPPPPDGLHVVGEVEVGNPGIYALLCKRVPQGINPDILLLDLHLIQRPGGWPRVITVVPARFDEVPALHTYTNVEIFCDGKPIQKIDVDVVS